VLHDHLRGIPNPLGNLFHANALLQTMVNERMPGLIGFPIPNADLSQHLHPPLDSESCEYSETGLSEKERQNR
jgi:hypothetical protein